MDAHRRRSVLGEERRRKMLLDVDDGEADPAMHSSREGHQQAQQVTGELKRPNERARGSPETTVDVRTAAAEKFTGEGSTVTGYLRACIQRARSVSRSSQVEAELMRATERAGAHRRRRNTAVLVGGGKATGAGEDAFEPWGVDSESGGAHQLRRGKAELLAVADRRMDGWIDGEAQAKLAAALMAAAGVCGD